MYRTPIEEAYITRQLVQVDAKDSWKVQHSNESYSQMTLADLGSAKLPSASFQPLLHIGSEYGIKI